MKIDKVILSANENKDYIDFWPLVSKAWERIGIEPILIYTGKSTPEIDGNVIKIYVPFVSTVFVSQNVRLLAPVLFPDENCIISDIDSLPLSSKYFNNSVNKIEENKFVIYRPDAAASNMIPICWNLAKGILWSQIFKTGLGPLVTRSRLRRLRTTSEKLFFLFFGVFLVIVCPFLDLGTPLK